MMGERSPNLGHLEGWGALLALQLRGAPSSWARPPASPWPDQRPPNHPLAQLILLAPLSKSQRTPLLSPRPTYALCLVWSWVCFAPLKVTLNFCSHVVAFFKCYLACNIEQHFSKYSERSNTNLRCSQVQMLWNIQSQCQRGALSEAGTEHLTSILRPVETASKVNSHPIRLFRNPLHINTCQN